MILRQILQRIETGMTLDRCATVALTMLFYEVLWLAYALIRLVVLPDSAPLLGYDFSAFWSAAQLAAEGRVTAAYDGSVIGPMERAVVPLGGTAYWHYPPTMSLLLTPLEYLNYRAAFVCYTLGGAAAWFLCARMIMPGQSIVTRCLLLAAPAAYFSLIQGQNGTYTTLLVVAFLLALERGRVVLAALCAALLLAKPHLGVLLPLIVILRGQWRLFPWGILFGSVFVGLTVWRFGPEHWRAFFDNAEDLWAFMMSGGISYQQISALAFFQLRGLPVEISLVLQILSGAVAVWLTWLVWRSRAASMPLRFACVLSCSLMVSPYAFFYDTPMVAVALVLLFLDGWERGFRPGERVIYAFVYFAPLLHAFMAARYKVIVLYVAILLLMWQVYRRYRAEMRREFPAEAADALS